MTTIIETIAATPNLGMPKKNGVVTPNQDDSATAEKVANPVAQATSVPATSPIRTATVAMNPRNTRWMTTISASVPRAKARLRQSSGCGSAAPPTASAAATGSSARPMIVMTDPVTTGGKNRISSPNTGAIRNVNSPATITDP